MESYSLHMGDSGTDNFDRDFTEPPVFGSDALYEIEEALKRIGEIDLRRLRTHRKSISPRTLGCHSLGAVRWKHRPTRKGRRPETASPGPAQQR